RGAAMRRSMWSRSAFLGTAVLFSFDFSGQGFEAIEARVPIGARLLEPLADLVQGGGVQRAEVLPPLAALGEQPRALEVREVLRDGLLRQRERRRELAHRGLPARQPLEDRPPRRVGE